MKILEIKLNKWTNRVNTTVFQRLSFFFLLKNNMALSKRSSIIQWTCYCYTIVCAINPHPNLYTSPYQFLCHLCFMIYTIQIFHIINCWRCVMGWIRGASGPIFPYTLRQFVQVVQRCDKQCSRGVNWFGVITMRAGAPCYVICWNEDVRQSLD